MSNQEESRWKDIYAKFTEENVIQDIANKDLESLFGEIEEDGVIPAGTIFSRQPGRGIFIGLSDAGQEIYTETGQTGIPAMFQLGGGVLFVDEKDERVKWWQDNDIYLASWESDEEFRVDPEDGKKKVQGYHFRGMFKYLPQETKLMLVFTPLWLALGLHIIGELPILITKPLTFPEWLHDTIHDWSFGGGEGSIKSKILWGNWFRKLGHITSWLDNLAIHAYPDWVVDRLPDELRKHSTIFFRYEPAQEED